VRRAAFAGVFAEERHQRLLWFCRLRWLAAAGLALASAVGPLVGIPGVWPSLLVIAVVVAGYNALFLARLRRSGADADPVELGACAVRQIGLDLTALLAAAHFTGGLGSPLLGFFAFHMAIGTIMIATRTMYWIAGATSLAMGGLFALELGGLLPPHRLDPTAICGRHCAVNMVTFVITLFGIVYLTDSVTSRFKQRSIELHETSEQLRERTRELQRLLEEIEAVERRKSHYMRISAHQLRSPLGTLRTTLEVLVGGYVEPGSERGRRLLEGAIERVDGLLAIVNDLLELAKIREGAGKAPWTRRVNLNQLLADLFDAVAPRAQAQGVRLVPEFQGVAVLEWGVPPDLVYAFENLMDNAIKYSRPGGEVTVRLRTEGEEAVVEVEDRGIGIPEEMLEDVFLEFVRAPNAKRHAHEGTGLGLSIAREAIRLHGGDITVRSVEGEGTTFTVRLPLGHEPLAARRGRGSGETPRVTGA